MVAWSIHALWASLVVPTYHGGDLKLHSEDSGQETSKKIWWLSGVTGGENTQAEHRGFGGSENHCVML